MNIKKIIIMCGLLVTNAGIYGYDRGATPADDCVKITGVAAMGNANIKATWGVPPCDVIDVSATVATEIYNNKGESNPVFATTEIPGTRTILLKDVAPGKQKTLTVTVKLGSCQPYSWTVIEGQPFWSQKAMDSFYTSANSSNPGFISRNMRFAAQSNIGGGCGLMGGTQECNSSNQCRGHCDYTCKGTGDYPDWACCNWWGPIEGLSHSGWSTLKHGIEGAAGDVGGAFESAGVAIAFAAEQTARGVKSAAEIVGQGIVSTAESTASALKKGYEVTASKIQATASGVKTLIKKTIPMTIIWTKNMAQALLDEAKAAGYLTKATFSGDKEDIYKNLNKIRDVAKNAGIQTAKAFETFVKNTTLTFMNIFVDQNKEKPEYCAFSNVSTHSSMPKTIDDPSVQAQDTEGLLPYIKKYSPISYLDKNELHHPIWADEYFTSPTTRLKLHSGDQTYYKGKLTFEKIYEAYTKCSDSELYFENEKCTVYGSNPAKNTDAQGNLTMPLYVVTNETDDKIYIMYLYFYGLNGPYDIGPFQGAVNDKVLQDVRNYHESDLEHISVELDKKTKNITRIYYGSHGKTEGFWIDAKSPDISWEGTHPVVYVAHYGHGLYPKAGTYVRIFGMANDVTTKGQRWEPKLMRVYRDSDKRFDPKTMGWLYWPGKWGAHGIGAANDKSWFVKGPQEGDLGRDPNADPRYCPNPNLSNTGGDSVKDFFNEIKNTPGDLVELTKYDDCLQKYVPLATIPD